MKIFHDMTPEGYVTRAQYVGPCGSQMAASFQDWLSVAEVERQLASLRDRWAKSTERVLTE
jgi:hypothetical protein